MVNAFNSRLLELQAKINANPKCTHIYLGPVFHEELEDMMVKNQHIVYNSASGQSLFFMGRQIVMRKDLPPWDFYVWPQNNPLIEQTVGGVIYD
jgi:hypothetical protein